MDSQAVRGKYLYWSLFFADHCIKQIDSMLPWVCSVIYHRRRQNVVKTSVTHASAARVPLLCFYHILTSSVTYHWTDPWEHGIYLIILWNFSPKQPLRACHVTSVRLEQSECFSLEQASALVDSTVRSNFAHWRQSSMSGSLTSWGVFLLLVSTVSPIKG